MWKAVKSKYLGGYIVEKQILENVRQVYMDGKKTKVFTYAAEANEKAAELNKKEK